MIQYIDGTTLPVADGEILIMTSGRWVQAYYRGGQSRGAFFLHPYLDDNAKTIQYFAFDTMVQKASFLAMLKISGIGPKTAFGIANMERDVLENAVDTFDIKALQSIPGVWPKTAKRLLVELKSTLSKNDVEKLAIDSKLLTTITNAMKSHGFDARAVKQKLQECPIQLDKGHMQEIVKRLITVL
jgi:holliday junction DNA helicase RuvA